MASTHTVESTPDTVRSGYLDPAAKPVATISPGDTVRYPNTWTHWGNEAKIWRHAGPGRRAWVSSRHPGRLPARLPGRHPGRPRDPCR
jgi:hypothetical protein